MYYVVMIAEINGILQETLFTVCDDCFEGLQYIADLNVKFATFRFYKNNRIIMETRKEN